MLPTQKTLQLNQRSKQLSNHIKLQPFNLTAYFLVGLNIGVMAGVVVSHLIR